MLVPSGSYKEEYTLWGRKGGKKERELIIVRWREVEQLICRNCCKELRWLIVEWDKDRIEMEMAVDASNLNHIMLQVIGEGRLMEQVK